MPTIGVAVTVPDPHGPLLQRRRAAYGDPMATAIPAHVTLLPPTIVEGEAYAALRAHVEKVAAAHEPFVITLRGTGTFRPVSPVVFVQVARGIGDCEELESGVRSGPLDRPLDFPYHPHVTVAHHLDDEALDRAFEDLADFVADFEVTGIDLYELGDDGVWRTVEVFPLNGSDDAAGSAPGVGAGGDGR